MTLRALKRISLKEEHKKEGCSTILLAGTVVWTKEPGVYLVESKCIEALEKKGIPFILVEPETELTNTKISESR